MSYIIVTKSGTKNFYSFQEEVSSKMQEGYIPVGGLTMRGEEYLQPMYKPPVKAPVSPPKKTSPTRSTTTKGKLDIGADNVTD